MDKKQIDQQHITNISKRFQQKIEFHSITSAAFVKIQWSWKAEKRRFYYEYFSCRPAQPPRSSR